MGDGGFAHPLAKSVLQLRLLDEDVMLWGEFSGRLRGLEVEAQPLLYATLSGARSEVHE